MELRGPRLQSPTKLLNGTDATLPKQIPNGIAYPPKQTPGGTGHSTATPQGDFQMELPGPRPIPHSGLEHATAQGDSQWNLALHGHSPSRLPMELSSPGPPSPSNPDGIGRAQASAQTDCLWKWPFQARV